MMRIGFFSGLFVLPAIGFLGCLLYEYCNFDDWMVQWNRDMCRLFSIPCPNRRADGAESRPYFQVFMLKYVCSMLVGVTSSVWLYSGKTVVSWRQFIERLQDGNCGVGGGGGGGAGAGTTGVSVMGNGGDGREAAAPENGMANAMRMGSKDGLEEDNVARARGTAYV